jgi:ubiquitin-conjugating enzyme E2 M
VSGADAVISRVCVQCLKRIYHPSIDLNGRVCLGLINEWISILNFESIIIELEQLLAQPSPSKPLVKDVGTCAVPTS